MSAQSRKTLTRREFIKLTALTTAGLGLVSCAPPATSVPPTAVPTQKPAGGSAAGRPLHLAGWMYHPEIIEENIAKFKDMYGEQVFLDLAPSYTEHHLTVETRFIAGEVFDVIVADFGYPDRWYKAGWLRNLEGLPDLAQVQTAMFPGGLEACKALDGKMLALPYYSDMKGLVYNQQMLDKAGLKPPTTWEEFIEHCRKLQKDGISQNPFVPQFGRAETYLSMMYSEGEPVFDAQLNPTFADGGVAFKKVLEMWKLMYDEKIVPPDILQVTGHVLVFSDGTHAFFMDSVSDLAAANDPKASKIAGNAKMGMVPGKTGETCLSLGLYVMGAKTPDPERAWNLMRFLGGKNKNGEYFVNKRWALFAGLGNPYKEVMADPDIAKEWGKMGMDMSVYNAQLAKAKAPNVGKSLWYAEWCRTFNAEVGDYLVGKQTVDKVITNVAEKAKTLKAKYPA